jgi:hypothetical protein
VQRAAILLGQENTISIVLFAGTSRLTFLSQPDRNVALAFETGERRGASNAGFHLAIDPHAPGARAAKTACGAGESLEVLEVKFPDAWVAHICP